MSCGVTVSLGFCEVVNVKLACVLFPLKITDFGVCSLVMPTLGIF